MKWRIHKKGIPLLVLAGLTACSGLWGQTGNFTSGSTGSFGAIDVTTEDLEIVLPADGIINATTVNVAEGFFLSFTRNAFNTPVFLLATGAR